MKTTLETSGKYVKTTLETSGKYVKTTLETSGEDLKLHSKRVEKICYRTTDDEVAAGAAKQISKKLVNGLSTRVSVLTIILGENTLETSGEDENHTPNEWRRCKSTLETSGEDVKVHSKRVGKM